MTVKLWLKMVHKFIIGLGFLALLAVATETATHQPPNEKIVREEAIQTENSMQVQAVTELRS